MVIKVLIRSCFLAGLLLVPCTCLLAQRQPDLSANPAISPEKRALIAQLLEVTEVKKNSLALLNSILDQDEKQMPEFVWQGLLNTAEVQGLSADTQGELKKKLLAESARMSQRVRELFLKRIDLSRIVEELSYGLYDKYFTEAEIKDLIIFYKSPTGKKSIDVMPRMFSESMSNTMEAIRPKALEIMTEFVNEEAERVKRELKTKKSNELAKPHPSGRRRKP